MKSYIQIPKAIRWLTKKNSRRLHFQLLEVMVAVFLLLLCAVPALQIYTNMYKEQAQVVRMNQRDHMVHLIHAKIVEQLYKREISLDEIIAGVEKKFEEEELQTELSRLKYDASYHLFVLLPIREKKRATANQLQAQLLIQMKDLSRSVTPGNEANVASYAYEIYIDRGAKGGGDGNRANKPLGDTEDREEEDEEEEDGASLDSTHSTRTGADKFQKRGVSLRSNKAQSAKAAIKPANRGKD